MGDILQACVAVAVWVLGAAVYYWVMKKWFPAKDGNEDNMLIFCVVSWPVSLLMMVGILVWDRIKSREVVAMTVSELCGKLMELCHQGKALDEVFIMVDTMVTDVDDDGLPTYKNEVAFNPMTLCVEDGRIYIRESPF